MRTSIILAAFLMSVGQVAIAQASEREHYGRRWHNEHHGIRGFDRSDHHRRGSERHHTRNHHRLYACNAAQGRRLSAEDLRAKLAGAGYEVWKLEPKRNGCVEAKVSQADGDIIEMMVDPATAEIKSRW